MVGVYARARVGYPKWVTGYLWWGFLMGWGKSQGSPWREPQGRGVLSGVRVLGGVSGSLWWGYPWGGGVPWGPSSVEFQVRLLG